MSDDIKDAKQHNRVKFLAPGKNRVRLEIDELCKDNEMTNLFLLALKEMYEEPDKAKLNKDNGGKEDWWTNYSLGGEYNLLPLVH